MSFNLGQMYFKLAHVFQLSNKESKSIITREKENEKIVRKLHHFGGSFTHSVWLGFALREDTPR